MEEIKNILPRIFQAIGFLIVFIFCYYSFIYITESIVSLSLGLASLSVGILTVLVLSLISGKLRDKNEGFTLLEGLFLVLYLIAAVIISFIMLHYVNVDYLLKDQIKTAGQDRIAKITEMVDKYEKKVNDVEYAISGRIQNAIDSYEQDGDFKSLKDTLQLFNISFTDKGSKTANSKKASTEKNNLIDSDTVRAKKNLITMKQENIKFIEEKLDVINNWENTKLHRAFLEIELRLERNLSKLEKNFEAPAEKKYWNEYSFEYALPPKTEGLISNPRYLREKLKQELGGKELPSNSLPLVFIILVHLCILFPYFMTGRVGERIRKRYYPGKNNKDRRGIDL